LTPDVNQKTTKFQPLILINRVVQNMEQFKTNNSHV